MIKKLLCTVSVTTLLTNALALSDKEKTYFETFGWIVGQQSGVAQLGLNDEEYAQLLGIGNCA